MEPGWAEVVPGPMLSSERNAVRLVGPRASLLIIEFSADSSPSEEFEHDE